LLGAIVGVLFLFLTPSSLSLINVISSLVYIVVMPYVGIALALLFYDLRRREPETVAAKGQRGPDRSGIGLDSPKKTGGKPDVVPAKQQPLLSSEVSALLADEDVLGRRVGSRPADRRTTAGRSGRPPRRRRHTPRRSPGGHLARGPFAELLGRSGGQVRRFARTTARTLPPWRSRRQRHRSDAPGRPAAGQGGRQRRGSPPVGPFDRGKRNLRLT
jgi:hypothetical protein